MRKGTLFLSAALTAFMLAILVGAASAYQKVQNRNEMAAQPTATSVTENISLSEPVAVAAPAFTPEQAAALAAQVIGRTDTYSVETADLNGATVFLVTFSSGDLVYVSLEGQIVSIGKIPTQVVSVPAARKGRGSNDNGNRPQPTQSSGHQEPEEHQEPEGHDD